MINWLENRRKNEDGSGEVITALFVIPMIVFLLILILDVGRYFLVLGQVSDITKEATRQVAIYGGDNTTLARAKLGGSVSSALRTKLATSGANISNVSCGGGGQPGDTVSCSVTFTYNSMMASFGGAGGLGEPKNIVQYSVAETWSN